MTGMTMTGFSECSIQHCVQADGCLQNPSGRISLLETEYLEELLRVRITPEVCDLAVLDTPVLGDGNPRSFLAVG